MTAQRFAVLTTVIAAAFGTNVIAAEPAPTTQTSATLYVEVYVRGDRHDQKVAGKLVDHDDDHLVIQTPSGSRDLTWDSITPSSGFTLKSRLIDKTSAAGWLALGRYGWEHGLEQQGKAALSTARKLDGGLSSQIDEVLAVKSGSKNLIASAAPTTLPAEPPASAAKDAGADAGGEAKSGEAAGSGDQDAVAKLTPKFERGQKIVHYTTPTPEQIVASMDRSRKFEAKVKALTKVDLIELETPHFLIYTDWDPREYDFLKDKCEGAYRVLAKQFAQEADDNVFVGKLPIYMFTTPAEFQQFAVKMDLFRAASNVLGYFDASDEIGHMAMWKPAIGQGIGAGQSLDDAKRRWARTLVHEFSHAFINRYRSNAKIPRWMNEGLAEVIAESELPTNNYHANARILAMQSVDIDGLFEDTNMPTGAAYPVMMTMVECLIKDSSPKFVALVNDIKDGTDPEDALQKEYGVRYPGFADIWHKYARSLK